MQNIEYQIVSTSEALQKVFAVRAIVFAEKQNALLARRAFISIENTSNTKSIRHRRLISIKNGKHIHTIYNAKY